jgi:hypothetical protein
VRRQIAKTCRLHGCYLLFSVLCDVWARVAPGKLPAPGGCANRPVTADAGGGAVGAVAVVSLCRMARGEVGDEGQLQLHARKSTRFDMHYSAFSGVPRARIAASVERATSMGARVITKASGVSVLFASSGWPNRNAIGVLCVLGPALRGRYMYMYMFTVTS